MWLFFTWQTDTGSCFFLEWQQCTSVYSLHTTDWRKIWNIEHYQGNITIFLIILYYNIFICGWSLNWIDFGWMQPPWCHAVPWPSWPSTGHMWRHSPPGRCSWKSQSRQHRCGPCRGRCVHTWCDRRSGISCSGLTVPRLRRPLQRHHRPDSHLRHHCPLCPSPQSLSCFLWTGQSDKLGDRRG